LQIHVFSVPAQREHFSAHYRIIALCDAKKGPAMSLKIDIVSDVV
jgi:hypothetical protein